jgi:hypothetical protein
MMLVLFVVACDREAIRGRKEDPDHVSQRLRICKKHANIDLEKLWSKKRAGR